MQVLCVRHSAVAAEKDPIHIGGFHIFGRMLLEGAPFMLVYAGCRWWGQGPTVPLTTPLFWELTGTSQPLNLAPIRREDFLDPRHS